MTHDYAKRLRSAYALSQHFRIAEILRFDVHASFAEWRTPVPAKELFVGNGGSDVDEKWLRLRLWYAYFFVVLEGFEELQLSDSAVDSALKKLKSAGAWDVLKRLRNATFHVQDDPQGPKLTDMLTSGVGVSAAPDLDELRANLEAFFKVWRATNADAIAKF